MARVRDATIGPDGAPAEKLQRALVGATLEGCQYAHGHGLSPLEVIESLATAAAHIADVSKIRQQAAAILRAWADDLEKTDVPVAIHVAGRA